MRSVWMSWVWLTLLIFFSGFSMAELEHVDVYVSGQDGYNCYRIPGIECAPDGSLLAFAEARKLNCGDPGMEGNDIDLVLKRSTDGGRTWSAMKVIEDNGDLWSAANPATCVDRETGKVWVLYLRCRPHRNTFSARPGTVDSQVLARTSDDNGVTWSEPLDLTPASRDMNDPHWGISVPGPGGMIQDSKGRLITAVWMAGPKESVEALEKDQGKSARWGNLALFSEDHGKTWRHGSFVPGPGGDENQLVELKDGRLLMDFRQSDGPHRWFSESSDGGLTWSERRAGLPVTPVCCAIERLSLQSATEDRNRILWTGPKGPDRNNLVARVSYDEGITFPNERLIVNEPAAYSDLTVLLDKSVGVLWERDNYKKITFTRLTLEFLEPR